jgi:putative membrane protein
MILHGKARRCVCRNPAYIDSDMTLSSAVVVWMGVMRAQSTDHAFLTKVAQAGEGEVMVAQDAQKKGAASEVKALAQRLEADHRKANSELRALIVKKRLTVPGGPTLEQKVLKNKLDTLQGAMFDDEYTSAMVASHTNSIKEFENATKSTDADVRAFAAKTLPTLREHLKMAQDARKTVSSTLRSPVAPESKR